jgi:hypothetical protein
MLTVVDLLLLIFGGARVVIEKRVETTCVSFSPGILGPRYRRFGPEAEDRYAVQRDLREIDEVETNSVLQDPFSGEPEKMLIDGEVTGSRSDHYHRQASPRKISVDVALVEWVEYDVQTFQDVAFVRLRIKPFGVRSLLAHIL